MYIVTAVIQRQLSGLGRSSVCTSRLLSVRPVSKLKLQPYFHGQLSNKKKPLKVVFPLRRGVHKEMFGFRELTPCYVKDNVPSEYEIIYQNHLGRKQVMILVMVLVTLLSYSALLIYILLLFSNELNFREKTKLPGTEMEVPTLGLKICTSVLIGILFFGVIIMHYTKLPVQRIYESPCKTSYIAVFKKKVFGQKSVQFELSDVKRKEKSGFVSLRKKGNVSIKGRDSLILSDDFIAPHYFNRFMGDDKGGLSDKKDAPKNETSKAENIPNVETANFEEKPKHEMTGYKNEPKNDVTDIPEKANVENRG